MFSWRLRAGRFVGSVTRRRGGPPAHRPSGRGPGCGFASDRAIPPPSQAGVGFGLWLGSPVWFCCSLGQREIKLRRHQGPTSTGGGVNNFFFCGNFALQKSPNPGAPVPPLVPSAKKARFRILLYTGPYYKDLYVPATSIGRSARLFLVIQKETFLKKFHFPYVFL